jgi:hypothetical protein
MKASTPSLILFFVTSAMVVLFKLFDYENLVLCGKSIIIPSLFIYYLVSNSYKISFLKAIIFLLLFIREVFLTLKVKESAMGAFICVLMAYFLLIYMSMKEFRFIKFKSNDFVSIFVLVLGIGAICYSVLNLELENLELDFSLYILFGVVLSTLSVVSIINYIKCGSTVFFNSMLMCVSFIISDVFFVVYKFYFYNEVFAMISLITQFLSYFFMTKYFLLKNKISDNLHNEI